MALDLLALEDRCREILARLPRSPSEDANLQGKMAWDVATEMRPTVECVGEELRWRVVSLERVSRVAEEKPDREQG